MSFGEWFGYWRLAWKKKPAAKAFSWYRAIPAILITAIQFYWRRSNGLSASERLKEMWIAIIIVALVYLILSGLHSIWNCFVVSPVGIYNDQAADITALKASSVAETERRRINFFHTLRVEKTETTRVTIKRTA